MKKLLTLAEAAERYDLCKRTLRKYIDEYDLPYIAFGRDIRLDPDKVDERLYELSKPAPTPQLKAKKISKTRSSVSPEAARFRAELGL